MARIRTVAVMMFIVALALVASAIITFARGPSTKDEREKATKYVDLLETQPLSSEAKEARRWLTMWLIEVPDISIKLCLGVFKQFPEKDKNYSAEITTQQMFSQAGFIIKNPEKANDSFACQKAGVEGALRTYQAIIKEKPKAKWPFLDELLEKQAKGELDQVILESLKDCKE